MTTLRNYKGLTVKAVKELAKKERGIGKREWGKSEDGDYCFDRTGNWNMVYFTVDENEIITKVKFCTVK